MPLGQVRLEPVPFELKEDGQFADRRLQLLNLLQQCRGTGIANAGNESEKGIGRQAGQQSVQ